MGTWRRFLRFKHIIGALVFVVFVCAGGYQAAILVGEEVRRQSRSERLDVIQMDAESRLRRALGRDYAVYRWLQRRLPRGALLAVWAESNLHDYQENLQNHMTFFHLISLLYPTRVAAFDGSLVQHLGQHPEQLEAGLFVLNLAPAAPPFILEHFEEIADGPREDDRPLSLWRLKETM